MENEELAEKIARYKKKLKKLKKRNKILQEQFDSQQDMLAMTSEHMRQMQHDLRESKKSVDNAYRSVMDSVNYAQRLQKAMLPSNETVVGIFPQSFVFYLPKDVVSGDFYWFHQKNGYDFAAAIDCTGHGVPGAMLTVLANSLLQQIVASLQITDPALILRQLDMMLAAYLHRDHPKRGVKDGLDIALIRYHAPTQQLVFAGAHRPLIHISQGVLANHAGARYSIGTNGEGGEQRRAGLQNVTINLQKGDAVYLFTDGYVDQFGGPDSKKLMASNLRQLLKDGSEKPMLEQGYRLQRFFMQWKGHLKQLDDVLVMGFKFF